MSVSVVFVHALAETVEGAGVSREELLKAAAFDPTRLDDIDARVGHDEYNRLLVAALDVTGDEALGLHLGEQATLVGFDVFAHLAAHAETMREAIASLLRFHRLATDDPEPVLEEQQQTATLICRVPPSAPRVARLRAEFAMVGYLRMVRQFAGRNRTLQDAFFEHAAPAYRAEYTRIFSGTERFGHAFTGAVFDREFLDCQQRPRHAEMYAAMRSLAERKLTRISRQGGHAQRLREYLAAQLPTASGDMESAARWFGISVRSLRRRLEEEHVSFTQVLAEARASAAKRMLEDPERSIGQTAYALGFSDTTAFHRAFKRWTGMTPAAYRARL
jgi:AraC-like DNA-binding protein